MDKAKHNFRIVFFVQLIVALIILIFVYTMDRGQEKDVMRGVLAGISISAVIQLLLFVLKPGLFKSKTDYKI